MASFLMVVGDAASLNGTDQTVKAIIEGGGHSVTLISDETAVPADMTPYDAVVIAGGLAVTVGTKYTALATPLVYIGTNGNMAVNLDFISSSGFLSTAGHTQATIVDDTHAIAGDLTGTLDIYNATETCGRADEGVLGIDVDVVAVTTGTSAVVAAWASGATMGGGVAAGPRAWTGLHGETGEYTADGETLVLQTFEWAASFSASGSTKSVTFSETIGAFGDSLTHEVITETHSDFNDPFSDTLVRTAAFIGTRSPEDVSILTELLTYQINGVAPATGGAGGSASLFNAGRDRKLRRSLAGAAR